MTFSPKVTKLVTRPILRFQKEIALHVRIVSSPYAGTPPTPRPGTLKTPVAPILVDVVNLDGNAEAALPVHPKLKATLDATYKDNSYVGKCFAITSKNRTPGVQYTMFQVAEIEDPTTAAAPQSADAPTHAAGGKRK